MTEAPRPPGDGAPEPSRPDPAAPPPPPPHMETPPPPGEQPPPAYGPPPTGYPPPPGGYGPPPGFQNPGFQNPGYPSQDDKTWALLTHFGGAGGMFVSGGTLGWVVPLIALLARGSQSPVVRAHAVNALNFQLLWSIIGVVGWILVCIVIGFLGVAAAWLIGIIFGVIAGVQANEGQLYRYPLSVNWIK